MLNDIGRRTESISPYREYFYIKEIFRLLKMHNFISDNYAKFNPTNLGFYHKSLDAAGVIKEWREFASVAFENATGLTLRNFKLQYNLGADGKSLNPHFDTIIENALRNTDQSLKEDCSLPLTKDVERLVAANQHFAVMLPGEDAYANVSDMFDYSLHLMFSEDVPNHIRSRVNGRLSQNQKDQCVLVSSHKPILEHFVDKNYLKSCFNPNFAENLWYTSQKHNSELPRWKNHSSGLMKCKTIIDRGSMTVSEVTEKFKRVLNNLHEQILQTQDNDLLLQQKQKISDLEIVLSGLKNV